MPHKRAPYYFLMILLLILCFVIGLRWGQNIEKTNKIINYMVSIPPSATAAPTQIPLGFKTYEHEGCGLRFVIPNTSQVQNEASNGAILQEKTIFNMSFDCSKNNEVTSPATDSFKLVFQKKSLLVVEKEGKYLFQLKSPQNGIVTNFFVDKSFFPLLEKSLEFVSK